VNDFQGNGIPEKKKRVSSPKSTFDHGYPSERLAGICTLNNRARVRNYTPESRKASQRLSTLFQKKE